jgi:hypothetical protein
MGTMLRLRSADKNINREKKTWKTKNWKKQILGIRLKKDRWTMLTIRR